MKGRLSEPKFALEAISTQSVLILQGGGALGAFECGVVKGNPGEAAAALEAFWNDLAVTTPCAPTETWRRALSSWWTMWFGSSHFFRPHWWLPPRQLPWTWTSLYDLAPARTLLEKMWISAASERVQSACW